jgi:hypothetical protein
MAYQGVPLDSAPNQTWSVSVSINGGVSTFFLELNFNEIANYWTMNISNSVQTLLLSGIPLLTGLNLLAQYAYLMIGSIFILNVSGTPQDSPISSDLGNDFVMVWGDNISTAEQIG